MTAISADWVLPVDGPPLEDAYVAWEDGRIVEVGRGRGDRHYDGAMILPGLVNAHSHLEYAVYAGFGDSRVFADWLGVHMVRKRALVHDEMVAIARPRRGRLAGGRDHDDGRLQLLRRLGCTPRPSSACARSSTWRCSAPTRS